MLFGRNFELSPEVKIDKRFHWLKSIVFKWPGSPLQEVETFEKKLM